MAEEPDPTTSDAPEPDGPIAFGAIGSEVFIADGDNLARWSENVGLEHIPNITPAQYMKFNGGYMSDPEPDAAAAAVKAYKTEPQPVGDNFSDPDVLHMTGPRARSAAFMVSIDGLTTSHPSFAAAAQHLAVTIGDAATVDEGIKIVEFSEEDGIVLTQNWTPSMIGREIAWNTANPLR